MSIDEEIIQDMATFGIEPYIAIDNILKNYCNNIATIYNIYKLLQKSATLFFPLFIFFIKEERNKLSYYNNDIDLIIEYRIGHINKCSQNIRKMQLMNNENEFNNIFNSKDKNLKNIYLFRKINHKIIATKKDCPSNRQKNEREKIKNYLINIPTKSHTIAHASNSSSKGKRIYKSPNLIKFNTRKYLKNNQSNINTIENQKQFSITYNNKAVPNFFLKKKFNIYSRLLNKRRFNNHNNLNKSGNKNGNLNNFKMLIYNKSLDKEYRKDRYKGINNYYNFKKFNIKEIKKKVYRTIETKRRTDRQNSYSPIITREINEQKNKDSYLLLRLNNCYSEINKAKADKNIMKLKKKKEEKKEFRKY